MTSYSKQEVAVCVAGSMVGQAILTLQDFWPQASPMVGESIASFGEDLDKLVVRWLDTIIIDNVVELRESK